MINANGISHLTHLPSWCGISCFITEYTNGFESLTKWKTTLLSQNSKIRQWELRALLIIRQKRKKKLTTRKRIGCVTSYCLRYEYNTSLSLFFNRSKKKKKKTAQHWVIDPAESFYFGWLIVITVAVMYNVCFVIARSCFRDLQKRFVPMWLTADYMCDAIYLFDIVVREKTGEGWNLQIQCLWCTKTGVHLSYFFST